MATPIQYKFVGASASQAPRISPELWAEHREKITTLHESHTLEEVIEIMAICGFQASRRQYVSQFKKWDLRKYNIDRPDGGSSRLKHSASLCNILEHEMSNGPHQSLHNGLKRRKSFHSIQSSRSAFLQTIVPPKKKIKDSLEGPREISVNFPSDQQLLDTEMPDMGLSDLACEVATSDVIGASNGLLNELENTTESMMDARFAPSDDIAAEIPEESAQNAAEDSESEDSSMSATEKTESDFRSEYATTIESQFSLPERWIDPNEVIRVIRLNDPQRPPDTFTEEEIKSMELAASYLHALHFRPEASFIYCLIVKWHHASETSQSWQSFSALVQYARLANSAHRRDIVPILLQKELDANSNVLKVFLCNFLLAHMAFRDWNYLDDNEKVSKVIRPLEEARRLCNTSDLMAELPENTRGLDLFTAFSMTLITSTKSEPLDVQVAGNLFRNLESFNENVKGFSGLTKRLSSRRFMVDGGLQLIECIRSCLRWCINELDGLEWSQTRRTLLSKLRPKKKKDIIIYVFLTQTFKAMVYTYLWDTAQQQRQARTEPVLEPNSNDFWFDQAQDCLGISPATLLVTVIHMDVQGSLVLPKNPHQQSFNIGKIVLDTMRQEMNTFSKLKDNELETNFLGSYLTRSSLFGRVETSFMADATRDCTRDIVLGLLRRSMMIIIPDRKEKEKNSDTSCPDLPVWARWQTLAPSLRSGSLHAMRAIQETTKRFGSRLSLKSTAQLSTNNLSDEMDLLSIK